MIGCSLFYIPVIHSIQFDKSNFIEQAIVERKSIEIFKCNFPILTVRMFRDFSCCSINFFFFLSSLLQFCLNNIEKLNAHESRNSQENCAWLYMRKVENVNEAKAQEKCMRWKVYNLKRLAHIAVVCMCVLCICTCVYSVYS